MPAVAVRLLFAALVVALPIQVAVRELVGEPYPGLYQPSFGGDPARGDFALTTEAAVTVIDRDGERHRVEVDDVLPEGTRVLRSTVFHAAFFDPEEANHPETVHWLRGRVRSLVPGEPAAVHIEWQRVRTAFDGGSREVVEVLRTVEIPFVG